MKRMLPFFVLPILLSGVASDALADHCLRCRHIAGPIYNCGVAPASGWEECYAGDGGCTLLGACHFHGGQVTPFSTEFTVVSVTPLDETLSAENDYPRMDRSPKQLQQRIDHMVERCREAGMNVTPQRIAIYRALLDSEEHPTPEMLYRSVSTEMPSLSLATIYKTLDALAAVGLVRSVAVDSDKRRYDANDAAHHHLVCSSCGCIRDYYSDEFDALLPPRRVQGFAPQTISVNITGICGDCRAKQRKEA